tara:strand:+ start:604 stop:945 length:342 start_codon:yes stop_codon:yes gene_type:complete
MTDLGLILTYIMIGIAVAACIISPILKLKNNPEKIKTMVMPIITLLMIIIISILISSNEVLPHYTDSNGILISSTASKIIGGCLITFYILSIITIGSVVYSEFLYKIFKNGKK